MPIIYKIQPLQSLKEKGFSAGKIRREKLIGERQIQQLREGVIVSPACLEKLCRLLKCQPGDILAYIPDPDPDPDPDQDSDPWPQG